MWLSLAFIGAAVPAAIFIRTGRSNTNAVPAGPSGELLFKKNIRLQPGEMLNINTATLDELKRVPHVNRQMAVIIMAHRAGRGAFVEKEDLKKLSGITNTAYDAMEPFIEAGNGRSVTVDGEFFRMFPRRINLNTAVESDLTRVPYVQKYFAGLILEYRQSHESFRSTGELVEAFKKMRELGNYNQMQYSSPKERAFTIEPFFCVQVDDCGWK